MNFYPIYKNKKLLPWIKWWLIKGNKVMPKHISEWINSASAITLTGVYKGSPLLNLSLNGNTSQTGTPTPEAPIPVNVVKGNNTITINDTDYKVNLKSKNLFDKSTTVLSLNAKTGIGVEDSFTSATNQKHVYIPCQPSTTYTITKGTNINTILGVYETSNIPAVGVGYKVLYFSSNTGTATVTTGNNANYLDIRITTNNTSAEDIQTILDSIQVEEGESPTTYEPYYDYELCKIDTYQDVIYKQNNKYYVEKHIGKIVLNGNESTIAADSTGLLWGFSNILSEKPSLTYTTSGVLNGYCDYYLPSSLTVSRSNGKRICVYPNQTVWITKDDLTLLADFRSFLNSHNVTLYYVLAESTTTEITETNLINQLEAIYNAKLNSGTNTITQTPADLPFYLSFQYYEKG